MKKGKESGNKQAKSGRRPINVKCLSINLERKEKAQQHTFVQDK